MYLKLGHYHGYCNDTNQSSLEMNKLTLQSVRYSILLELRWFIYFLKFSGSGLDDQHNCFNGILYKTIELHKSLSLIMHWRPSCILYAKSC